MYGFGTLGHGRLLLSNSFQSILSSMVDDDDANTKVRFDPIALSVLHDIVVNKAVQWIEECLLRANVVPLGEDTFIWNDDMTYSQFVRQEIIVVDSQENRETFEIPIEKYPLPMKRVWKPTIIIEKVLEDRCGDNEINVSGEQVKLITTRCLFNSRHLIMSNELSKHAGAMMTSAVMKYETSRQHTLVDTTNMSLSFVPLSPIHLLFLLQHHPTLSSHSSLNFTETALIALSAGLQYLVEEIVEASLTACKLASTTTTTSSDNNHNEYVITVDHIRKVIVEDKELDESIDGMIRYHHHPATDDDVSSLFDMKTLLNCAYLEYSSTECVYSVEALSVVECVLHHCLTEMGKTLQLVNSSEDVAGHKRSRGEDDN